MSKKGTQKDPAIMEEIPEEEAIAALNTTVVFRGTLEERFSDLRDIDAIEEAFDSFQAVSLAVKGMPEAKSLYQKAMGVMRADLEDRQDLLEKMPKPLQSLVGNLADAVDRFQATSKDVRNEVDRAWSKVLVCLGKLIEGIGKHLNIEAIEKQGKELVKASQAKLAAVKEIGSHTQALLNKRKQLKSQNLSK